MYETKMNSPRTLLDWVGFGISVRGSGVRVSDSYRTTVALNPSVEYEVCGKVSSKLPSTISMPGTDLGFAFGYISTTSYQYSRRNVPKSLAARVSFGVK